MNHSAVAGTYGDGLSPPRLFSYYLGSLDHRCYEIPLRSGARGLFSPAKRYGRPEIRVAVVFHGVPGMTCGARAPLDGLWWLIEDSGCKSPMDPDDGNRIPGNHIWARRPQHSKPDSDTEGVEVDAAGRWGEGRAAYPGRSVNLPSATGIERCWDGLAKSQQRP